MCVRILLYMCPHTAVYVSAHYYVSYWLYIRLQEAGVFILYVYPYYYMCPHTITHVSSYCYICVLTLRQEVNKQILRDDVSAYYHVSSYHYMCVLLALCPPSRR